MGNLNTLHNCKNGMEFEKWVCNFLIDHGIQAHRMRKNDDGVDICAFTFVNTVQYDFTIQCKYHNNTLGKAPVQEVYAGTHFKGLVNATPVVFTNNSVTHEARLFARSLGVEIIADTELFALTQLIEHGTVLAKNYGTLMQILIHNITGDNSYIPEPPEHKERILSNKDLAKEEIISDFDKAEEYLREAERMHFRANECARQALALQKQAMLRNLEYG